MNVLVCGGAGYIGSHMVQLLAEHGHSVVTFDNLSTGHQDAVLHGELVVGDVLDTTILDELFRDKGPFDLVMHFCARSLVGESVERPALYYRNNVVGTLNLLDAMREHGHDRLVFSSTAATYGVPTTDLIDESHTCSPINPYGRSKLMVEQVLRDYADAYGLRSVSFRYFNACGAHPTAPIGERHEPETHLIPNILLSLLDGGKPLQVFGDDYDTPDGSCIRDYIHVGDLCDAHLAAASYMDDHEGATIMNLGNGKGFSVFEVIEAVRHVTGRQVEFDIADRRPGDPSTLVADASLARRELGWTPRYSELEEIVSSAWAFHRQDPTATSVRANLRPSSSKPSES